jgi:SAM-dependent methyltransferase
MFGIGTLTALLALTLMGPKVCAALAAIAIALLASLLSTFHKAQLSDASLAQDLARLKQAFDTDALNTSSPGLRDVIAYYTRTTDRDYRVLSWFMGQGGLHTSLAARPPVGWSNDRQVMYVANAIAAARAGADRHHHHRLDTNAAAFRVLEVGSGRGYCTLMLAGLFAPSSDFEFHGVDLVQRHVDVARQDAVDHNYTNVHFYQGDAAMTASFRPRASFSAAPFDIIFGVEALCHLDTTYSVRAFLVNAANHLAPGHGRLVIIDGFRSETFPAAPADQQLAMRLAERAFGIKRMRPMSEWIEAAHSARLRLESLEDLTHQALPFWTLGWRFAHTLLRHAPAWVVRRLRATPYTAKSTDNLLAVATVAHAMRNRAAAVYGVMVFSKKGEADQDGIE